MTYKEKIMKEAPFKVDANCLGGCMGCPGSHWEGAPNIGGDLCPDGASDENCRACWNTEIPCTTKPTTEIDIHKIIDDAMDKKDREVTIFIGESHTHITVSPLKDSKPRWIFHRVSRLHTSFECSECGAHEKSMTSYCPHCGEKLAAPIFENEEGKEGKDDE